MPYLNFDPCGSDVEHVWICRGERPDSRVGFRPRRCSFLDKLLINDTRLDVPSALFVGAGGIYQVFKCYCIWQCAPPPHYKVSIVGNAMMLGHTLQGHVLIVFWRVQEGYISAEKARGDSSHLEDVSSEN